MLIGPALLVAAFLLWLVATHLRERPWFERPDVARHRLFDRVMLAAAAGSFAGGMVVVARRSPVAALGVATVVGLAWGWRRLVRSAAWRRRALRRDLEQARRADPAAAPRELLLRVVLARHPEWGEELVAQMVLDYPDAARLAAVVARMERGFRGFRSGLKGAAGRSDPARRS